MIYQSLGMFVRNSLGKATVCGRCAHLDERGFVNRFYLNQPQIAVDECLTMVVARILFIKPTVCAADRENVP